MTQLSSRASVNTEVTVNGGGVVAAAAGAEIEVAAGVATEVAMEIGSTRCTFSP
ncbi:hypothetical protein Sar04_29840 [Salinispora arenicola]|uniref:Uncharacterized protein n=1 Tax=Salinispora arenicola TaxID=168697 RepID=A0ABQ4JVW4_SALAC|nr:hypothetical protein Sar04_29840 [Salinispora arenicola]